VSPVASFPATTTSAHDSPRRSFALWVILAMEFVLLCLPATLWAIVGGALAAVALLLSLIILVLGGQGAPIILAWVLIFPLGYHFVAFPREQALITLDRILVGILLVTACFGGRLSRCRIPPVLQKSAFYWGLFLFLAALTIPRAKAPLSSLRLFLDALVFPGLLAWYVLRYVDVRSHLRGLHIATSLMAIYVAALGFAEIALQTDLLPVTGGGTYLAGGSQGFENQLLMRPNGPFSTDDAFALIGIVSFFFLLFLRQAIGDRMPAWQRILHRLGVAAALAEILLPLFRSVIISLVLVLILDAFYHRGWRRSLRLAAIGSLGLAFLIVRLALPGVFEERTSSMNVYGRIAAYKQLTAIFLDHPLTGVGLNNFADAAQNSKYVTYAEESESVDSPHSSLGGILAETGLIGTLPFVLSQVTLVYAFLKLRQVGSRDSKQARRVSLYILLCYWVNGLTLTIIYSPDLNIWYLFVLAVLYKFAITSQDVHDQQSFGLAAPLHA